MNTTYIGRQNTNNEVYRRANEAVKTEGGKKQVRTFRQAYNASKIKRLNKTINLYNDDPVKETTFENVQTLKVRIPLKRKRQRPKYKWADRALLEIWHEIQNIHEQYKYTTLDTEKEEVINAIIEHCKNS